MPVKLFVGNLTFQTTEAELRRLFAECGEVVTATIITDRDTGQSRGFGFVEMADDDCAQAAIQALHGQTIDGRRLGVEIAKPKESSARGGGYTRTGSGSGGRGGRW